MSAADALLIELEADELREMLPSLADTLYEFPLIAHVIEVMVNDILANCLQSNDGQLVMDIAACGARLGAWRKVARDVIGITEAP